MPLTRNLLRLAPFVAVLLLLTGVIWPLTVDLQLELGQRSGLDREGTAGRRSPWRPTPILRKLIPDRFHRGTAIALNLIGIQFASVPGVRVSGFGLDYVY